MHRSDASVSLETRVFYSGSCLRFYVDKIVMVVPEHKAVPAANVAFGEILEKPSKEKLKAIGTQIPVRAMIRENRRSFFISLMVS